jgi:hypothetical protein
MLRSHEPAEELAVESRREGSWIESPVFDLTFFVLSPLVGLGLLLFAPHGPSLPAMVLGALLGIPHYLSTFVFYLWDENHEYHRSRWLAFFGGPVVIMAVYTGLMLLDLFVIVGSVIFIWNAYHVARQNCGIASLYRHRAGVTDPAQRSTINGAIVGVSLALTFWHAADHPQLPRVLARIHPSAIDLLRIALVVTAVMALWRFGTGLRDRYRAGQRVGLGEACFLGTSLLMFHPYLWVRNSSVATLGMLLGHFVQYLGLVWLVHRRRFAKSVSIGSSLQRGLARVSTNLGLLLGLCLLTGGAFLVSQILGRTDATVNSYSEGFLLLLALMHFYLDGLFWAFKDPQVRRTIGPLVIARRPTGPAGAVS